MNRFQETYIQRTKREAVERSKVDLGPDLPITFDSILDNTWKHHIKVPKFNPNAYLKNPCAEIILEMRDHQAKQKTKHDDLMDAWMRAYVGFDRFGKLKEHMKVFTTRRHYGKSILQGLNSSAMNNYYGSWGTYIPDEPIHAFDPQGNYHELSNSMSINIPTGWYFLIHGRWYYRIVRRFRLETSQVPKVHRLYLRLCHIVQPE